MLIARPRVLTGSGCPTVKRVTSRSFRTVCSTTPRYSFALRSGQVVVMDNLAAHKGQRIKELIEERGCELMYLPPYSPDLNPIEESFSKVKRLLRETEARIRKGLIEAMGVAISEVTAQDAHGFFEHCGHHIPVQPL